MRSVQLLVSLFVVPLVVVSAINAGHNINLHRPKPDDAEAMARWLVAFSSWGVLSTLSIHLGGTPWGNIASFSDGPKGTATGTPYFYLSRMDPTPLDIEQDARCSLSLSEAPIGTCGSRDVEDPTCARLTLSGKMVELSKGGDERKFALKALFSKHPEMAVWPKGHDWRVYKLKIEDIFLVDFYGGAKEMSVEDYYNAAEPTISDSAI
ncbi:hypothetical protein Mapa_003572 [Marchantia paleacea]|nr:hypothetical protein Mapa_003572 [Marchantia paleacea]